MGLDRNEVFYVTTVDGKVLATLEDCEVTFDAKTVQQRTVIMDNDGVRKTKVDSWMEEPPTVTITGKMVKWDTSIHTRII